MQIKGKIARRSSLRKNLCCVSIGLFGYSCNGTMYLVHKILWLADADWEVEGCSIMNPAFLCCSNNDCYLLSKCYCHYIRYRNYVCNDEHDRWFAS